MGKDEKNPTSCPVDHLCVLSPKPNRGGYLGDDSKRDDRNEARGELPQSYYIINVTLPTARSFLNVDTVSKLWFGKRKVGHINLMASFRYLCSSWTRYP